MYTISTFNIYISKAWVPHTHTPHILCIQYPAAHKVSCVVQVQGTHYTTFNDDRYFLLFLKYYIYLAKLPVEMNRDVCAVLIRFYFSTFVQPLSSLCHVECLKYQSYNATVPRKPNQLRCIPN